MVSQSRTYLVGRRQAIVALLAATSLPGKAAAAGRSCHPSSISGQGGGLSSTVAYLNGSLRDTADRGVATEQSTSRPASSRVVEDPGQSAQITIRGLISRGGGSVTLDRNVLDDMGSASFKAHTDWYSGDPLFSGVPFSNLMRYCQCYGSVVQMMGLDDYQAHASIETMLKYNAMLATRVDGRDVSVDDKGPYQIVFPFDDLPGVLTDMLLSIAVYQLTEIVIS